jgi:hypothetical protein
MISVSVPMSSGAARGATSLPRCRAVAANAASAPLRRCLAGFPAMEAR